MEVKGAASQILSQSMRAETSLGKRALRLSRRKPLGAAGALVVAFTAFIALSAPLIAPHNPDASDTRLILQPPSPEYPFGTDNFGRDMLSRVMHGSRVALAVGILVVGIGSTAGGLLGLVSGFSSGKLDLIAQRFVDILMAFPPLILAMAIVAMFSPSTTNVILALAVVQIPNSARVVRSAALYVRETDYVTASRAIGCRDWEILLRHILPNCLAPFIIVATAGIGIAILSEASLSFLGLGSPITVPSWGGMLSGESREFVYKAWWIAFWPGLAITLAVFAFSIFGDALRDVLDPRLRTG
ncbi:MAG: ABC transporter permease [Chloroflexi bacterium]|nr:ABC transporter permease [Chloroflexota bacterium]